MKRNIILAIIGTILMLFLLTTCEEIDLRRYLDELANKETWHQVQKLTAGSDADASDNFGASVSIDGDQLIIGASLDDSNAGAAYIFNRSGDNWERVDRIPDTPEANAYFGSSIGISGDYAVIGALGVDKAYIYKKGTSGWDEIKALSGSASTNFSTSVSIYSTLVIVGAPDDTGEGITYIYYKDHPPLFNWDISFTVNPAGITTAALGSSVAMSSTFVIVGDPGYSSNIGAVLIYEKYNPSSWSDPPVLFSLSDGTPGENFGYSVGITDSYAIVGAPGREAAYIYQHIGEEWVFQTELTAQDSEVVDKFGTSVAISGDYIIVGAPYKNSSKGVAYVFERSMKNEWFQKIKLTAKDGVAGDLFGLSVSISGAYICIGASNDDSFTGSAYIYKRY